MKNVFAVVLKVFLGLVAAVVLAVLVLVVTWLVRRQDPTAFLPDGYVAWLQVPSVSVAYDRWLNLQAADVVLGRPGLSAERSVLSGVRALALTRSPLVRAALGVRADVMLLTGGRIFVVLDLGWRGIFSPVVRMLVPRLGVKGLNVMNYRGVPLYQLTSGTTSVYAALYDNVAVVTLDLAILKTTIELRKSGTGLAGKAARDFFRASRLRNRNALRLFVDTSSLSVQLIPKTAFGAKVLRAVQFPGPGMIDVELSDEKLMLGIGVPLAVTLAELAAVLDSGHVGAPAAAPSPDPAATAGPAPIGVLGFVPSTTSVLAVSTIAPLSELYRVAAAFQGKLFRDEYAKADSDAKLVVGMGIQDLVFSWVGAEVGAFVLPASQEPVFFARIADQAAWQRALAALTKSTVAGRSGILVLDGIRINRLSLPWLPTLWLSVIKGVTAPEPYFLTRGGYIFLSLEAQNLVTVAKSADSGNTIASYAPYAELTHGQLAGASLMLWYNFNNAEPFTFRGGSLPSDLLRLYARGMATVRLSPTKVDVAVSAARADVTAARSVPGFPLSPAGGPGGDVLAFRFAGADSPTLAWVRNRDTLVLSDARGAQTARAQLQPGLTLLPERDDSGAVTALWVVSSGGTVWRFGPRLETNAPFPIVTGIKSPMPPAIVGGRLVLYSPGASTLAFVAADGRRTIAPQKLEAAPAQPPHALEGRMTFSPKSFDARVHLADMAGVESPGWPVAAAGISVAGPRLLKNGSETYVAFLTQAGSLHLWTLDGRPAPHFPMVLPGVFYAAPEAVDIGGKTALAVLSQDGGISLVGLDGSVLLRARLPDVDGRTARLVVTSLGGAGRITILVYGSGAFIAGLDTTLQPLRGFPLKGVSMPQLVDLSRDGTIDLVTTGLDGKIYAYAVGKGGQ